jgi:hypothetical protein
MSSLRVLSQLARCSSMSELGQPQASEAAFDESASPPTADLPCRRTFGGKVPKGDNAETLGRLRGHLGTTDAAEVTVVLRLPRGQCH